MRDSAGKASDGSYGVIDGVEITEEVITRLVKNAEDGSPGATFRAPGRPSRTDTPSRAVTVRLSKSELAASWPEPNANTGHAPKRSARTRSMGTPRMNKAPAV